MNNNLQNMMVVFALLLSGLLFAQTQTFNSSGNFMVPAGVTSIKIDAWGGGGGGGGGQSGNSGSGGGGGAYVGYTLTVIPGQTYNIAVGQGGSQNSDGTNSTISLSGVEILKANAGSKGILGVAGGNGGAASTIPSASGSNFISYKGGNGAGGGNGGGDGGGGGGSAGNAGAGVAGGIRGGGPGGPGGGAKGGNGGDRGFLGNAITGSNGSSPGAGGGGRSSSLTGLETATGGNGANGRVIISFSKSDLQVAKSVNKPIALINDNVVFTVTAINNGPGNVTDVKVTDLLPSGYTYVSHTVSAGVVGDYIPATGIWTIGTLNNGATRTLNVTVKFISAINSINSAIITSGNNEDVFTDNNTATATVSLTFDSDGDGVPGNIDLDSDNDGILDCVEKGLTEPVDSYFQLNGDAAKISDNEFRLTPATANKAGQAWSKGRVDFAKSFTLTFQANLGSRSGTNGGDGIAAVFHNSAQGTGASGDAGNGLGARGIKNGIVLELDTYANTGTPAFDPASTQGHGMIWKSELQTNLTSNVVLGNLKDNAYHNVVVSWDVNTKTLSYTVDGILAGSYTNLNFYNDIFGSPTTTKVYFGFTASTGAAFNDQRVKFANACADLPLERDTDGDGIPDHLDLDSDGDGCFDAIEGGGTITSAQLNANGSISGGGGATGIPLLAGAGQAIGVSTDVSKIECKDSDGDGIPDYKDLDKDNDGILDKAEGYCKFSSDIVTDGFDSPVVANLNANNIQTGSVFNGWTAINASTSALIPNAFNVIKVNGTTYSMGPNNAQSGNQYIDINGADAILYKQFTIATPTVVSASAYFANRDSELGVYAPWDTKIEIVNAVTNVVVASGNNLAFTASLGDKQWFRSSIPDTPLPAGTYRVRMFVSNHGHIDSISYCFSTDSDGDGVANYLDLDSDGDGCFDAVEGDENVLASQLNANGSINIATTGGIDANGVPNLVNLSGTADVYGDQGQGVGNAKDALINGCKEICTEQVLGENFSQTGSAEKTFTQPGTNYGFVFDIFTLDNSFNMTINGTALATAEVQFQSGTGLLKNIKFLDGAEYDTGGVPQVYNMTGTQAAPLIRVVISPSGSVRMYGSKSSGGALLPLTLYNGTIFNVVNWNATGTNTVKIKQLVSGTTYISGRGYGVNVIPCPKTPDAINDTFETTNFGGTTASVLENDTYTDGTTVPATTTNVILTQVGTWPAGITLNADGTITIAPDTALGTFALEYQICATEAPANCDTAIATVSIYIDTDGDGVPDYLDLDSDNDGILDSEECAAIDRVAGSKFDSNGDNTTTSTIAGWNLSSGSMFSSQNNYVQFVSDTGVQSLSQAVSNISWNGEAPVVNMQFNARNTTSNISNSKVILTIAYEGTVYATLTTANNNEPATFVANNGATLIGGVPTYESDGAGSTFPGFVMQSLTLPNTVPTSGTFVIKFDPLAGGTGNASARDDINLNLFSIQTCVDTDGDGIPDYLDLDSDGDGCADAIEGSGDFSSSDLIDSALIGGNTGDSYTGTSTNGVIQNFGNVVGDTETTLGIPTIAGTGQTVGSSINAAINACFCYIAGVIDEEAGSTLHSRVGISALARTGVTSTWPGIRKSGWIVLEAKTKGFVINRVQFNASNQPVASNGTTPVITNPVEGMMVFDITNNCLKVYTYKDAVLGWYCMETQTCPE